jgi:hypothetical protein
MLEPALSLRMALSDAETQGDQLLINALRSKIERHTALYNDLLDAVINGNNQIDELCSKISLYDALLDAINRDDTPLIKALCRKVSINARDAKGLFIIAKYLIAGSGTLSYRRAKAWALVDGDRQLAWAQDSADTGDATSTQEGCNESSFLDIPMTWVNGMVQGLAAVDRVSAQEYCDHSNFKVPPIWYAWGLAYSGNEAALDSYFEKYGAVDDPILKTETTGIVAHAILTAAAIYGGKKDLATRLREKILKMDVMQEVAIMFPNEKDHPQTPIIIHTKSLFTITEALGVIGDQTDIVEFFEWIDNAKRAPKEGHYVLSSYNSDDIAVHLQEGLVKGGHNKLITKIIKILSTDRNEVKFLSKEEWALRVFLCGSHFLDPEKRYYCELRAKAQTGDTAGLEEIFQAFSTDEAKENWTTTLQQAMEGSATQFLENGYPAIAIAIEQGIYKKIWMTYIGTETTASLPKGYTLSMPRIYDDALKIQQKWEAYTLIPYWVLLALRHPLIEPLDYCPSFYTSSGWESKLNVLPSLGGPYVDDRVPRLAPLHSRYSTLHFLCSIPDDTTRAEVCSKFLVPKLGGEAARDYLTTVQAILQMMQKRGIGFTAAASYRDNSLEVQIVIRYLQLERNMPAELIHIILSHTFIGLSLHLKAGECSYTAANAIVTDIKARLLSSNTEDTSKETEEKTNSPSTIRPLSSSR